jgi:hypothetical protein
MRAAPIRITTTDAATHTVHAEIRIINGTPVGIHRDFPSGTGWTCTDLATGRAFCRGVHFIEAICRTKEILAREGMDRFADSIARHFRDRHTG